MQVNHNASHIVTLMSLFCAAKQLDQLDQMSWRIFVIGQGSEYLVMGQNVASPERQNTLLRLRSRGYVRCLVLRVLLVQLPQFSVMDENKSTDTFVARTGVAVGFLSRPSLLPPLLPLCSREWGRVHFRARLIQGPLVYISNIHCALSCWKVLPDI